MNFTLLFLSETDQVLLSKKKYSEEEDIQKAFKHYTMSIGFETLEDVIAYMKLKYNLADDYIRKQVAEFATQKQDVIQLYL